MKVVHYFPTLSLDDGGAVRALIDLCNRTVSGNEVVVATTKVMDDARAEFDPAVSLVPLPRVVRRAYLVHLLRNANAIHLHSLWAPLSLRLANVAAGLGVRRVLTLHGVCDPWSLGQKAWKKKTYLRLAGRRLLRSVEVVHATASAEASFVRAVEPSASVEVNPYVLDLKSLVDSADPIEAIRNYGQCYPTLLFLSRVHPKKGLEALIHALPLVRRVHRNVQLIVAGPGQSRYIEELRCLTKSVGVKEAVRFVGMVYEPLRSSLYAASDAFVLPTHQENFGIVFAEALSVGCRVVTTDRTDVWQEIEQLGGAVIVPDRDGPDFVERFAEAICRALERQGPGVAERDKLLEWLDPECSSQMFMDFYSGDQRAP